MNTPDYGFLPGESAAEYMLRMGYAPTPIVSAPIAQGTQRAAREVLGASAEPSLRRDTTDIVTGKPVVNIRVKSVSNDQGNYVHQNLLSAQERAKTAGTVDLRSVIDSCNAHGPFPGIAELLTSEEQARLHQADEALAVKCFQQFCRLALGENVEEMLVASDKALNTHIVPLLSKLRSPATRKSIEEALHAWNTNLTNPSRNFYYRTDRVHTDANPVHREYAVPMLAQDPRHFSVGYMDNTMAADNIGAGYAAMQRVMFLRRPNNPQYDFLDTLNILHELTHVVQHSAFVQKHGHGDLKRMEASHKAYVKPLEASQTMGNGIAEEEAEAFANMIEPIFAKTGFGTFNIPQMLSMLGCNPNDDSKCRQLYRIVLFGQKYFEGGARNGNAFPRAYVRDIADFYKSLGQTVIYAKDIVPPK